MIKGIIFDMDGVILNTETCHFKAWKKLLKPFHVALTWEMYTKKIQVQGRQRAIQNMLGHVSEEKFIELSMLKEKYYFEAVDNTENVVYKDCIEWIQRAHAIGIPMVVASSSKSASKLLKMLDLSDYFVGIFSGSKVKEDKPDPEVFLRAVQATGFKPEECVVFEDAYNGIKAGIEAGCQVIAINREGHLPLDDMKVPTYENFYELGSSLF